MVSWLFVIAIILTLITLIARKQSQRHQKSAWSNQLGCTADNPLMITRFDEINLFVYTKRCPCGGKASIVSEGSRNINGVSIRVIQAECVQCENQLHFFFDLTTLQH